MTEQMTPAEMREQAKRLRQRLTIEGGTRGYRYDMRAGADALDRLADPVELGRLAWEAVHDHGAFARDFPDDAYYQAVGEAIARGEEPTDDPRP